MTEERTCPMDDINDDDDPAAHAINGGRECQECSPLLQRGYQPDSSSGSSTDVMILQKDTRWRPCISSDFTRRDRVASRLSKSHERSSTLRRLAMYWSQVAVATG